MLLSQSQHGPVVECVLASSHFEMRVLVNLQLLLPQTDPENTDYSVENGAYRTFQAERLAEMEEERLKEEAEEEEANNPMLVRASGRDWGVVRTGGRQLVGVVNTSC